MIFLPLLKRRQKKIPTGALPEGGRSSAPAGGGLQDVLSGFSDLRPKVDIQYLDIIKTLVLWNPDWSQATENFIASANTGHDLIVEGASDRLVEAGLDILNEAEQRICPYANGIDGLINNLLRQILIGGALSAEAVLEEGFARIQRVVAVPVSTIRFRRNDEGYPEPWQKVTWATAGSNLGYIKLNPITYRYSALNADEESPYGIPPFTAALPVTLIQKKINENIDFICKKLGLLGLIEALITKLPRKPNEDDDTYRRRSEVYLKEQAKALEDNFYNGLLVHFADDLKIEFNRIAEGLGPGLGGTVEILRHVEQLIFSGLQSDAAMHGRSYSTTETYAYVVYTKMTRFSGFLRALVRHFVEHVYRLETILQGVSDLDIGLEFNPNEPFNEKIAAENRKIDIEAALLKAESGMVDPDTVAQEMGYEGWHNQAAFAAGAVAGNTGAGEARTVRFRWKRERGRYVYEPPSVNLYARDEGQEKLERLIAGYLEKLRPFDAQWRQAATDTVETFLKNHKAGDFSDGEAFADAILRELEKAHKVVFAGGDVKRETKETIEDIYVFYRLTDKANLGDLLPDLSLLQADTNTIRWVQGVDAWFFSKFFDNGDHFESLQKFFIDQYLRGGAGLFGAGESAALEAFRTEFAGRLADLSDFQIRRIIDTSVQRMRTWAHFRAYAQAGVEAAVVVGPDDKKTCDLCRRMLGKIVKVKPAVAAIDRFVGMAPDEFGEFLKENRLSAEYVEELFKAVGEDAGMGKLVELGVGIPPYHPLCRHRTVRQRIGGKG